jgi:small subunit ribosomal protein S8
METSIIDMIIRIKNGYLARLENVILPHSKYKEELAKKLLQLGFIKKFEVSEGKIKNITLELNYEDGIPKFTDVKIFSKQGRRWYITHKKIKKVLGGMGCSLISTPKGIKTDKEAREQKIGGELLFNIW